MRMKQTMAIGVLLVCATSAMAGRVIPAEVHLTLNADGSGTAGGSLVAARFSNNPNEFIGCSASRYATTTTVFIHCTATRADGVSRSCLTNEPTRPIHSLLLPPPRCLLLAGIPMEPAAPSPPT